MKPMGRPRLPGRPVAALLEEFAHAKLRRTSTGWACLCPFPDHADARPSFAAYTRDNSWHCFGCGRHGGPAELLHGLGVPESEVRAAVQSDGPDGLASWVQRAPDTEEVRELYAVALWARGARSRFAFDEMETLFRMYDDGRLTLEEMRRAAPQEVSRERAGEAPGEGLGLEAASDGCPG